MRDVINGKTYNTETSTLVKAVVIPEDLTNGYTRYRRVNLYFNKKTGWFLVTNKTTVDNNYNVIDVIMYITPVEVDFSYRFRENVDKVI
jgi:hypothetical protein